MKKISLLGLSFIVSLSFIGCNNKTSSSNYENFINDYNDPNKEIDLTSIRYAADRVDDVVKFTDEALKMLVKVPRPFLKLVLTGCVNWAKENNCTLITEKEIAIINDKRSKEKKKK